MPIVKQATLESARIRVVPSGGENRQNTYKATIETETTPNSLTSTMYNPAYTVSGKNNHLTSIDPQNMSSTMPTTMPH